MVIPPSFHPADMIGVAQTLEEISFYLAESRFNAESLGTNNLPSSIQSQTPVQLARPAAGGLAMKIPTFNSLRDTTPIHNIGAGQLDWILRNDPILAQRTQAVRSATDPGRLKLRLPGVSLGGVFKAPCAKRQPRPALPRAMLARWLPQHPTHWTGGPGPAWCWWTWTTLRRRQAPTPSSSC